MTRTFIAIELGEEARAALRREIERLRRALPGVRWVNPDNLHLTVAFLGELDEQQLLAVMAAASTAAAATAPFMLELAGLGTFGPHWAPRVVWAGIGGQRQALLAAEARVARALEARGFLPDERPYSPHLTLARLPDRPEPGDVQRLQAALREGGRGTAAFAVETFAVMKSELLRGGAHYTRLRECRFGAMGDEDAEDAP